MKKLLMIPFIFFCIQSFSQTKTKATFEPQYKTILTSENGVKMINQCSRSVPENIETYFDLTMDDISILNENFKKILSIKSTKGRKIKRLEDYAFQYIGMVINNRKYIYINAFLIDILYGQDSFDTWYKEWKNEPIIMCDGGDGFWGILFDLENQSFSQLSINGII